MTPSLRDLLETKHLEDGKEIATSESTKKLRSRIPLTDLKPTSSLAVVHGLACRCWRKAMTELISTD